MAAGLTGALHTGWEGLLRDQREFLDEFWEGADVTVEGDPALQQAVRFALFHVLQNSVRAEERPIAGEGPDRPRLRRPLLLGHRHVRAAGARAHLARGGRRPPALAAPHARRRQAAGRAPCTSRGAAFPWRTINGEECSGYWPAGTAAFHVNADIADAVIRYHDATRDEEFDAEIGIEILVETARLWVLARPPRPGGAWHIGGVTGPDEYSAVADDNVYTNLMAQRNLRAAAVAAAGTARNVPRPRGDPRGGAGLAARGRRRRHPVTTTELGVHEQSAGFTRHAVWDFEHTPPEDYPLLLHYPYFDLYRKQVIKQADLVLAMQTRGDAFTRRAEGGATSPTTRRSPCATRRCRRAPRP